METYYLIDFENVHNDGIANIESMTKEDHVHIFSTQNATNIRQDIFWLNGDIKSHLVPIRKQSLDMHLVSYLGYLLGIHGRDCNYVIISKDKDYDNIVKFWQEEGCFNISRKEKLLGNVSTQKKTIIQAAVQGQNIIQNVNSKINAGMAYKFNGDDRSKLNVFMQHGLMGMGYDRDSANRICKIVIAHCNEERMFNGIHNELRNAFTDYLSVYENVKSILEKFVQSKSKAAKRESQIRSFFGQHFKEKKYVERKEEIIQIILKAETKQQVNNSLLKLYSDGTEVSYIYKTVQPLIKDLPGK